MNLAMTPLALWKAYQEDGLLYAINQLNPAYHLITNSYNGWQLAKAGCVEEAARALTGATFDAASLVALAAGGVSGARGFSPGRTPTAAAKAGSLELPAGSSWGRADTLADHFARHGADFGAKSEAAYAQQASSFFQRGLSEGLPTKIDSKTGVIRMYDPETNSFGSFNADGTTRTYFKPDPASHPFSTNLEYWESQSGDAPWTP